MIKRLFDQLNRQLIKIEDTKEVEGAPPDNADVRAQNARTLVALERSLERLTRLEQQRAVLRSTKVSPTNDEARTKLERRLDKLLAAGDAPKIPDGSQ